MEKQLPKNWLSIPFTDIFDINGGTQPPKSVFINEPKEGYIRLLQIRDFGSKPVPTYIPDTGKLMTCKKDDILIARYGASIGRIVTGMEGSYNVALAKVSIPESINKNFVKWLLKSNIFQEPILSIQRTAQNGFNKTDLASIYIPLPPQAEQNRIVSKLDTLFAQLETIKTSMAKAPLLLKDFRQQVLTQAVTGKLTEEWRKGKDLKNDFNNVISNPNTRQSNLKIPNNWLCLSFDSVVEIKSNLVEPNDFLEYPLIAPDNIESETGRLINKPLVSDILPISPKHYFKSGSIIYSKIRPYLSKLVITDFEGLCSADMYPLSTKLETKYLFYYMLTNEFLSFATTAGERSVLPKINQKGLNIIPIPVPSLKEQQEIVSRVESMFAKADAIEKQYESLKAKIESLPQAILHKAFKGELTEQLDSDGDAKVLLEEIEALKASTGKLGKSKTNKTAAVKGKSYPKSDAVLGMVAEK